MKHIIKVKKRRKIPVAHTLEMPALSKLGFSIAARSKKEAFAFVVGYLAAQDNKIDWADRDCWEIYRNPRLDDDARRGTWKNPRLLE